MFLPRISAFLWERAGEYLFLQARVFIFCNAPLASKRRTCKKGAADFKTKKRKILIWFLNRRTNSRTRAFYTAMFVNFQILPVHQKNR